MRFYIDNNQAPCLQENVILLKITPKCKQNIHLLSTNQELGHSYGRESVILASNMAGCSVSTYFMIEGNYKRRLIAFLLECKVQTTLSSEKGCAARCRCRNQGRQQSLPRMMANTRGALKVLDFKTTSFIGFVNQFNCKSFARLLGTKTPIE